MWGHKRGLYESNGGCDGSGGTGGGWTRVRGAVRALGSQARALGEQRELREGGGGRRTGPGGCGDPPPG